MPSFVYIVQNLLNSHCYVGVSANDLHRLNEHRRGVKSNLHLQNAIKLYGIDKFDFWCVEEWPTFEEALHAEEELIEYFKSIGCILYNKTNGGEHWPKAAQIAGGKAAGGKTLRKLWKTDREGMLVRVRQHGSVGGKLAAQTWLLAYNQSTQGRAHSAELMREIGHKRRKCVQQLSLMGDVIKEFKSAIEAAQEMQVSYTTLCWNIQHERTFLGFNWRYNKSHK